MAFNLKREIQFKIYPEEGEPHFFRVFIFRSRRGVFRHWRLGGSEKDCRALAFCRAYDKVLNFEHGAEVEVPCLGDIVFSENYLTHEIVAHEVAHAALHWAGKRLKKPARIVANDAHGPSRMVNKENELFCEISGRMVAQIVDTYRKAVKCQNRKK